MFNMSANGIITMARGDSWKTRLFINVGSNLRPVGYELKEGDIVYFGVCEPNQPFKDALICKKYDLSNKSKVEDEEDKLLDFNLDGYVDGFIDIDFKPIDTEFVNSGIYYYEVKLLRHDEEEKELIDTLVYKTKFIILE